MLGEKVSAADAAQTGMIYKVYDSDSFAERSWQLAITLASLPLRALALTKQALNATLENSLTAQLQVEARLQHAAGQTADFREGIAAFREKRKPIFTGK